MDKYAKTFCESLKAYFDKEYGEERGAVKKFAQFLELSHGQTSNMLRGVKGSTEGERRRIAKKIGYDYDEMIGLDKPDDTSCPENNSNPTSGELFEIEHVGVIKRFRNKGLAKAINEKLLALESINPAELNEIDDYILFRIAKYDRRKSDQPDKIPKTGDRRKRVG